MSINLQCVAAENFLIFISHELFQTTRACCKEQSEEQKIAITQSKELRKEGVLVRTYSTLPKTLLLKQINNLFSFQFSV
jgi:hypothetical protein